MQLVCPACAHRFALDDSAVPAESTSVTCPRCRHAVPAGWPTIGLDLEAPAPARPREEVVLKLSLEEEATRPAKKPAGATPASPPARVTPKPAAKPTGRVQGVMATPSDSGERWRFVAAVGGTALVAVLLALLRAWWVAQAVPPPEMPNPLAARVEEWRQSGLRSSAPNIEVALKTATEGLALGTPASLRQARRAARSALLVDAGRPAAIAIYGLVLARWPDRVENDSLEEALGAITSAVGDDPRGGEVPKLEQARAWLLMRTGRHEAARQAAERALALEPAAVDARFTRAVVRIPTRPEEALGDLAELVRADAQNLQVRLWLGEAHWRAGNVGKALSLWEEGARGQGDDAAISGRLARAEAQLGDHNAAVTRLAALVGAGRASVDDRLLLARLLARHRRQGGEAERILEEGLRAADLFPLDRARLLGEKVLVLASASGGKVSPDELSRWLDEGLAAAPDLPELLYAAALVDAANGARERAVESLEAALELAPERPEIALRLALALRGDDPEGVQQAIALGLRETPHYAPLHLLRAALAMEEGDRNAAAAAVRRSLDFDPERHGEGRLLTPWIDPAPAHLEVARLMQRHLRGADNPTLTTGAAMAYFFAGDARHAEVLLGQALRADPNEMGARLVRAVVAMKRGRRAAVLKDLRAAAVNDSQHAIVRLYLARLYEEGRRYEEAERLYRDQVAANPLDAAGRLGLARVLAGRGRSEDARQEARALLGTPVEEGALRLLFDLDRGKRPRRR